MIETWLESEDRLRLLVEPELESADPALRGALVAHLDAFIAFHGMEIDDVVRLTYAFLRRHKGHVKGFLETRRYPAERAADVEPVDRTEYELALLLSTLTTWHRYRIMELVAGLAGAGGGSAAVIGCGPGLELSLLSGSFDELLAFDIEISPFCAHRRPAEAKLIEAPFTGAERDLAAVYLIELLEHVDDPFGLVDLAVRSTAAGGQVVLTTVTDEPQFDHVRNFGEGEVESFCAARGLAIAQHHEIPHRSRRPGHAPRSDLFVIQGA